MRRSHFLKYSCILLMLAALVRVFFGLMMINFFATARTFGAADPGLLRRAGITLLLLILCAIAELVGGFVGALNWEEPLNAKKCVVWGCVSLALGLAGNLMQALTGYGVSYVAWITGVAAPLIYLIAALRFSLRRERSDSHV